MKIKIICLTEKAIPIIKKVSKQKQKGTKITFYEDKSVNKWVMLMKFNIILDKIYKLNPDYMNKSYNDFIMDTLKKEGLTKRDYQVLINGVLVK